MRGESSAALTANGVLRYLAPIKLATDFVFRRLYPSFVVR